MTVEPKTLTLTEFMLARIAEDEAVARDAVIPAHDGYRPHPELARWQYLDDGEVEYVQTPTMLAHDYPNRLYVTCDSEGLSPSVDDCVGPHIARHDPARVLAECEAKRRIVGYRGPIGLPADGTVPPGEGVTYLNGGHAAVAAERDRILRFLAMPYANHPDYDEAWKP